MTINTFKLNLAVLSFCAILTLLAPAAADAQRRDYLTPAEIELVRDNQEIDLRIGVLTKAIDRRLAVVSNNTAKVTDKPDSSWGELPKGTRFELFSDIDRLLRKAIDDIDDVASRNMDSKLFPKAMNKLIASCQSYVPQFRSLIDTAADDKEKGALLGSLESCGQIIEAAAKVPKEPAKEEKKKKKDSR